MWRGWVTRSIYICRLNFGPPQFLFENNDHVTQFVRKPTFDPLSNWSKTQFWSTFISSNWIKIEFSISLKTDQKWVWVTWPSISKRNWGGSKLSLHAYAPRDSPPSHTLLDQNLDPRVIKDPEGKIENSGKSIFKIRNQNFCYIQVILFDLRYLPVAAVGKACPLP